MRAARRSAVALIAALASAGAVALPAASAPPQPYRTNDAGGFYNILPPGSNGLMNAAELAAYVATGARPANSGNQLRMYENLVYATPGLTRARVTDFFKDASFGIQSGDVASTLNPRPGVTIQRDRAFGVPRVYGTTRADTTFGAGYANAQDRLFFMDVLRNAGRSRLSAFAGGANRAMDEDTWALAPYTEADLQRQFDDFDNQYGAEGARIQADVQAYVDGINAYIAAAKLNPLLMPGEYAALGKPGGPERWKVTDVVATATLIGSIFGKGGGGELDNALAYQAATKRFGRARGAKVYKDLRSSEDPEAPVTVRGRRFPYQTVPRRARKGSLALPDRGSVRRAPAIAAGTTAPAARPTSVQGEIDSLLGSLRSLPKSMSNALLVAGRNSASGRPLAVFGPQTGYFSPQILWEVELHGPNIDARGIAFNGAGLYVTIGRGRDYAWSATSASQDIIDTFAVDLCEPGGGRPTIASRGYRFRGACLPFETLSTTNSYSPNLADSTPKGSFTLRAERSKLGIVQARATIKGRPVAYTRLRSTYMHEADSAIGIARFNDPAFMTGPRRFQQAAMGLGYTFHWFYADSRSIAYINTGANPIRAKGVNPDFPVSSRFTWRGFDPATNRAAYMPMSKRPQTIDQGYIVNWNNKGARGYTAADSDWEYTPIYRSQLLEDQVRRRLAGGRKMTLPELIDSMEVAGSGDLRAIKVLPYMLRALGSRKDPRLRAAVATLRSWMRDGGLRRDMNRDGVYEHSEAIRILDAWWPRFVKAALEPGLGADLYGRALALKQVDNDPNNGGAHLGSAYQGGSYGLIQKDLRRLLGNRRLKRARLRTLRRSYRYSRAYCGATRRRAGSLRRCSGVLAATLSAALGDGAQKLYGNDKICNSQPSIGPKDPRRRAGDQFCWDSIWMRSTGAQEQPIIHWINRPTFQQAVEVQGTAPR